MDSKIFLASSNGKAINFFLPADEAVKFGRKEMKVPDVRCSREHLELTANYQNSTVLVKNLSQYPLQVGDVMLKKGESATLKRDDILKIVRQYEYKLVIKDSPPAKRKHTAMAQSSSKETNASDSDDDGEVAEKLQKLQQTKLSQPNKPETNRSPKASVVLDNFGKDDGDMKQESCETTGWRNIVGDMMLFESPGLQHSSKIVAFDLDGTIIETKSGKTFAVDSDDWAIMFPAGKKLPELHRKGFKVVFITNQGGISKKKPDPEDFKKKVEAIIAALKVPIQVFVLIQKTGIYRKPGIGVFEWLQTKGNGSINFTKNDFIYVGDAAGRPKGWAPGKKKDFSCSDRCFALNVGCEFFTPEEFFHGIRKNKFELPKFDPRNLPLSLPLVKCSSGENGELFSSKKPEIVVFVGYPASGKSTFAKTHFEPKGYVIINQDTLKTKNRCMAACKKAVETGQSCVIDNTNVDENTRKSYIEIAKAKSIPIRCVYFDMEIDHVFHNNKFRAITDPARATISQIVLYTYRKQHQPPNIGEGFNQVIAVNFVPEFKHDSHRALYNQFLSG